MEEKVVHRAEEHGQSRELKTSEVGATTLMAGIESVALASAAGIAIVTVQGIQGHDISILTALATGGVVGGLSFYFHVAQNFGELRDGLRSFRFIESFQPAPQQTESPISSSPIIVKPYQAEPYVLDRQEPLALPDGRQSGLGLNPQTVTAILREVITQHGGLWSRDRLMGIRIDGKRVSRTLYNRLTDALARAGFLQERSTGGFRLPADVEDFDDLGRYFPALVEPEGGNPAGTAGGKAGRQETDWENDILPTGRGLTAAERHRLARFEELDYRVRCYLRRGGS